MTKIKQLKLGIIERLNSMRKIVEKLYRLVSL